MNALATICDSVNLTKKKKNHFIPAVIRMFAPEHLKTQKLFLVIQNYTVGNI